MSQNYELVTKAPSECTLEEIRLFTGFVEMGGEVSGAGLTARINRAHQLVFLKVSGEIVGTAGLKNPWSGYRDGVARKSRADLEESMFPFELGWVFIAKAARGNKFSIPLSAAVLAQANGRGIWSSSRTENHAMHHVLEKFGFVRAGKAYPSGEGSYDLQVFVRPANDLKAG